MAGPGGGSSGGGFGGGSFSGGGSGGGSFGGNFSGGSFHGNHHHTHHHGGHWGRPGGFFGIGRRISNGCGTIIFLIVFIGLFLIAQFGDEVTFTEDVCVGDVIEYNEVIMQEYANDAYGRAFREYDNYENNILLVFLTNEECDGYYTIAWVGDNIKREINEMFGMYSEYGNSLQMNINQNYYAYSLDMDLTEVVMDMTGSITSLGYDSSFVSSFTKGTQAESVLINKTAIEMEEANLNVALRNFTEKTGIPCVIVVDSAEKVFGGVDTSVTATENVSVPPASVVDEEVITHDNEAETEIIEVQPTYTVTDDSADIAIIGGADGPTQITVGGNLNFVPIIAGVLIAIAAVVIFLRLKKGNNNSAEKGKSSKEEKPPWEL